jgi:hypothetical protein
MAMHAGYAVLLVLIVLLIVLFAFLGGRWMGHRGGDSFSAGHGPRVPPEHPKACDRVHKYRGDGRSPYTALNDELDDISGYRNDGFDQPPVYRDPRGIDRYHRSSANIKPSDIAAAEREQWYPACTADSAGPFNTELAHDCASDTLQAHTPQESMNYGEYVTDLIADPRLRDNQRRWVEEMKPWSGTAMKVDDLDLGDYVNFTGLRRPQPTAVLNPMQLNWLDPADLATNPAFNFRG